MASHTLHVPTRRVIVDAGCPVSEIDVGIGANVLGRGDLRGLYKILALKIGITRSTFLHIGYNLQNFQTPNYLMLGLGFRFHNKYPKVRH